MYMNKIFKNVFLSVGMFAFALAGLVSVNKAEALACTMTTGTWNGTAGGVNDGATNGTTTFSGCTGNLTPAIGDTLTIPANVTLQIIGDATIVGITIADPAATGANGITVDTTKTLTNTGTLVFAANTGALHQTITLSGTGILTMAAVNITMNGSSGAGNQVINVGGGVLLASTITIIGGDSTGETYITASTGTIQA